MSLKQPFLFRPLPKIVTTYHYSCEEYPKMEHLSQYDQMNGNVITETVDEDICKCSFCTRNDETVKRCICARNRSPSPFRKSPSPFRRSPSPMAGYGYELYQKSLLEVPFASEYGDASSDDLSSEWDSDVPDVPPPRTKVGFYFG